jgi:hypothetical protein
MLRSMLISATTLLMLAGCGDTFKDAAEERAYLSALSNPTPAQWKRLKAIDGAQAKVDAEAREESDRESAIDTLEYAKGKVGIDDEQAARAFRGVIKNFPRSEQALEAAERLKGLAGK